VERKILRLIEAAQLGPIGEEDLITSSQTAINFLEQQTLGEPSNQAELGLLREPKLSRNSSKSQLISRFLSADFGRAPESLQNMM
jgi:hypothetical protein